MTCPECGSNHVHRSRRRGTLEERILPVVSVFPFRCSECKTRFMRVRMPARQEAHVFVRDPPAWARALFWTVVTAGAALGVALLVVYVSRR
jgi:hypothetical protein